MTDEIGEMHARILALGRARHPDARGIPSDVRDPDELERRHWLKAARFKEAADLFRAELRSRRIGHTVSIYLGPRRVVNTVFHDDRGDQA